MPDDLKAREEAELKEPLPPVAPWRPGLSRHLRHHWTGQWGWFDRTCRHCGLRMLRSSKERFGLPNYKRPEWSTWRTKPDRCILRPGAPELPRARGKKKRK